MKNLFVIVSVALLSLSACTKNVVETVDGQNEIRFQTANYATKASINGVVFPTTEKFGVYAWSESAAGPYFMNNETVSYVSAETAWKPSTTYYWPKNATVDFVCFYPQPSAGLTVAADKLTYTSYNVNDHPAVDLMYADKAVGYNGNVDEISDGVNSYKGIPVIFRHALAKVKILLALSYNHKEETDGTKTDWDVTVNSFKLDGVYSTGNCELDLSSTSTTGLVGWSKPAGNVWSGCTGAMEDKTIPSALPLAVGTDYEVVPEFLVLPQTLTDGQQKVTLNVTIKTKRNGVDFLSETFDIVANLRSDALSAWEMNKVITYRISLAPTKGNGNGGNPIDPNNPVDPNNPDLNDAIITFDPATDGWENVNVITALNI